MGVGNNMALSSKVSSSDLCVKRLQEIVEVWAVFG